MQSPRDYRLRVQDFAVTAPAPPSQLLQRVLGQLADNNSQAEGRDTGSNGTAIVRAPGRSLKTTPRHGIKGMYVAAVCSPSHPAFSPPTCSCSGVPDSWLPYLVPPRPFYCLLQVLFYGL